MKGISHADVIHRTSTLIGFQTARSQQGNCSQSEHRIKVSKAKKQKQKVFQVISLIWIFRHITKQFCVFDPWPEKHPLIYFFFFVQCCMRSTGQTTSPSLWCCQSVRLFRMWCQRLSNPVGITSSSRWTPQEVGTHVPTTTSAKKKIKKSHWSRGLLLLVSV